MKKSWLVLSTLGAGFLFLAAGNAPAFAKDRDDWRNSGRREIISEVRDVRHDEAMLASLEDRLCAQQRHHDYRSARCTEDEIRALRRHIESDRRDIHRDVSNSRQDDRYRSDRYIDSRNRDDRYNDNRDRNYRREYRR